MPSSTTLIPGKLLRLNCGVYPPTDDALWSFTAEGSTSSTYMTDVGDLVREFTQYFYIDQASLYDLVARTSNANASYCGTYTCIDYRGADDSSTATVASKCTMHSCIHCVPKKEATKLLAITLSNLNRFSKFFHC